MIHRRVIAQEDYLCLTEHTLPLQASHKASELDVHIADYIQDCLFEKELVSAADQLILRLILTPVRRFIRRIDIDEFRWVPGASYGMTRIVALGKENVGHVGLIALEYFEG
jgi:hypothetical protein